jgi:hypothetical protein
MDTLEEDLKKKKKTMDLFGKVFVFLFYFLFFLYMNQICLVKF